MDPRVPWQRRLLAPSIAIGMTASVLVAATLLLPGQPSVDPLAWAVVGLGAALSLGGLSEVGRALWDRFGVIVGAAIIALLIATTGGPDSIYQDIFVVLVVASAVVKSARELAVDLVIVIVAASLPLLFTRAGWAFGSDLLVDLVVWIGVAMTARFLSSQYAGARSELDESHKQFQLLAADVPAIVYRQTLDPFPLITWISDRAEAITGFPAQAFLDDPDLAMSRVPESDREIFRDVRRELDAGRSGVVRYRFDRADGTRIWLEDHHAPVTDAEGNLVASQGVAFDASARVAAEQALADAHEHDRLARQELRRLLAAQRAFVQNISHELRTPLTSVVGFADVLHRRDADLSSDRRAHLTSRLVANTHRLRVLIEDLVDIDRLVADSAPLLRTGPHDLRMLVEEAVTLAADERHPVTVEGDPGVAVVDPALVKRLVRHLVSNAVRHTPAGTRVTCRIGLPNGAVQLVVEDDGPGVPESLRPHMFEPFVQGPQAPADPSPGTGVGLALAARLAQAHRGQLWHEVPEGGGARFCAVLRPG